MQRLTLYGISAMTLVLLIALALLAGSAQLLLGGAEAWPDVIADPDLTQKVAVGMSLMAIGFIVGGIGLGLSYAWAFYFNVTGLIVLLFAAAIGNYLLFGDVQASHVGTNIVIASVIIVLLIINRKRQGVARKLWS
jgi:hypothetical protein